MKAEDLRRGNFLMSDTGFTCTVSLIAEDYAEATYSSGYGGVEHDFIVEGLKRLKPIPLTEEWLLKLGFEFDPNPSWKYIDDDGKGVEVESRPYWYKRYNDGKWDMRFCWYLDDKRANNCNCEYVHQLQNAYFALTVEELTLKK